MFKFSKSHAYSIGVDIGDESLKLVQLGEDGNGISLIACQSENLPEGVKAGSSQWQRWAIETIRQVISKGGFQGKEVIAALPASEVFIDNIKMPKSNGNDIEGAIFSKIKQKLPFEPIQENTMIKYLPMEQDNALVIAAESKIIDRHLAIYEKAGLSIKSLGIWPTALANCYAQFFGYLKSDIETIVMLVCIEANYTNVVICRHNNLLFAHSLSIGQSQLNNKKSVNKLVLDLTECRRQFVSMNPRGKVGRLVFLISQTTIDKEMCVAIAKQLDVPAQVGDCLAAVEIAEPSSLDGSSENDKKATGIKKTTGIPIERAIAKKLDIPAQVGDCLAAVDIAEPCCLGGSSENDKKATGTPIERAIAKQLDIAVQVRDRHAAVDLAEPCRLGGSSEIDKGKNKKASSTPIEKRKCEVNWATAFGLSLS